MVGLVHVPGQSISSINKEHNSLNVIQDALVPAVSGSLYDRLHETRYCSILDNTVEMSYLLDNEAPRSNRQRFPPYQATTSRFRYRRIRARHSRQ